MLQVNRVDQISLLFASELTACPDVVHGFSTRRADHNNFTLGPATDPFVQLNRARFLAAVGAPGWPILKLIQTHSDIVCDIEDTWAANEAVHGDAAVTSIRGALLSVQTADCVPILVAHKDGQAIAAIHAGWRGTAAGIARKTILRMIKKFNIRPNDLIAVIGPNNGVCCYEVGPDVVEAVGDSEMFEQRSGWVKPHLNQALANRRQLIDAGIPESQIGTCNLCTQCRGDLFFSYRREGSRTGRLLAVIGLKP